MSEKNKAASKDVKAMKEIAEDFLQEVSGEKEGSNERPESEVERNIRLSKEEMERGSDGTSPKSSSRAPAEDSPAKPKAKPKPKPQPSKKPKKPAFKTPPTPDFPKFVKSDDKAEQLVNSIIAQLKVQTRPDGQFSESMRNAATGTLRSCDTPHAATWSPADRDRFWKRYFELLVDREQISKVVRWRLSNDRFCTSVSVFKQHARMAVVTALLESIQS